MTNKAMINATINNATENDINVLKAIFGNRIKIAIAEVPAETKKSAPKASTTKKGEREESEDMNKPTTRQEGIDAYKIQKYGSLERAAKVAEMTKVIAEEWREEAKKTGKLVVARNEYKTKLFETAYERVLKEEADAKKSASKTVKKSSTTKTTKKTTATNTKKSAPKKNISMDEELPFA